MKMANSSSDVPRATKQHCRQYEVKIKETQVPILYSSEYNIDFCGLDELHGFDIGKWSRIIGYLKEAGMITDDALIEPMEASEDELLFVHHKKYLDNLKWSWNVANLLESPPLKLVPNFIIQKKLLRPYRFQVSGSIMAARVAVERGWAINIGGGFSHASQDRGGGLCLYADITMAVKYVFDQIPSVTKVMIIDLDAHQGNGYARDFMGDERVYIFDMYNRDIYPRDGFAKRAIKRKVELTSFTTTEHFMKLLKINIEEAFTEFTPDLVCYNAGVDIMLGDHLGNMTISTEAVIDRDAVVFYKCRSNNIPIFMVIGGGYIREAAKVVARSILNLKNQNLISCPEPSESAATLQTVVPSMPRSHSEGGLFARLKRSYLSWTSASSQNISQLVSPSEPVTTWNNPPTEDGNHF